MRNITSHNASNGSAMTNRHSISKTEHRLVSIIAGFLALVVVYNLAWDFYLLYEFKYQPPSKIQFSGPMLQTPLLHLMSLVVLAATVLGRKYVLAMLAVVAYIILIFVSFQARYQTFDSDSALNASLCHAEWLSTYPIDYLALIFLTSLGLWYVSIFWRFGFQGNQRSYP